MHLRWRMRDRKSLRSGLYQRSTCLSPSSTQQRFECRAACCKQGSYGPCSHRHGSRLCRSGPDVTALPN